MSSPQQIFQGNIERKVTFKRNTDYHERGEIASAAVEVDLTESVGASEIALLEKINRVRNHIEDHSKDKKHASQVSSKDKNGDSMTGIIIHEATNVEFHEKLKRLSLST